MINMKLLFEVQFMKIKPGFTLKNNSGQNTIVATRENSVPLNDTITLSETTAYLWELLCKQDMTKEELLHALLNKFDISTVLALNDIDVFVKAMKESGILE